MWKDAERILLKDIYISLLIKKWGHCTISPIKKLLYFQDLVEAITNQQLSGKAASTIFGRVKDLCKGEISPDVILKLSETKLRSAGLSFAKIKYIKDLSSKVKSGELEIDKLDKLTDEEVIKELVVVKGIGRWTAEMFLMFALARPDIFPVDDLGIQKGFEKVTGKKWDKVKSADFAEKHWKPYRTIASWYLWRSLENR
jgi:DNA-3-methyladenine glycosylase II